MQRWLLLSAWMLFGTSLVLKSGAADWYVALDGTGQGTGGWESATNDLQGAIDACVAGDTVWVSNGVYQSGERLADLSQALSNRVVITKPITVRSLSDDPAQTVIKGRWDSVEKNGPAAVRCVYVSIGSQDRALLSGFTFTNGATLTASADDSAGINQRGGGIYAASSGELIVSNCIIAGNSAFGQGGGAYGPALSVYDSVFVGNAVRAGISSYRKAGGGGACACKLLSNCLLTNNAGDYGSAAGSIQQMHNCLVVSNKSLYAVYSSTLYNCLVANNTSSYAVRDGRLYNCTVANNSGYGLYHEVVAAVNTVVYFNTLGNCYKLVKPKPMMYCCTTPPLPDWATGDDNITNAPSFVNMAANDFRLKRDSPCINAGTNGVWTAGGFDLDGESRIDRVSDLVDMGCYEYEPPYRGTLVSLVGYQPLPVPLVENGQSRYAIYTDTAAPASVRTAAADLQVYVEKVSGVKLSLVNQPCETMIALGNTLSSIEAGLHTDSMPLEGYRIVVKGQNVFIAGIDSGDNARTPQGGTSQGTANGVYAFIEQFLGVRWLMPGEHGDYVPVGTTITIPCVDIRAAPFFLNRRLPYIQEKRPEVQRWMARQRLGLSLLLTHSHNWQWATLQDFQAHPDWFAEQNGVRMPPVNQYSKFCASSESLIRAFSDRAINYFDNNSRATCYSLSPSDGGGWCQCAACTALYEQDPDGKLSVTPAIINFYNKIAQQVAQKYPEKVLAGYVYAAYVYPPSNPFQLAPNMFLVWAPSFDYGFTLFRPDVQQRWDNLVPQWGEVTDNIAYYDLPAYVGNSMGAINPPGLKILKWLYPRLKLAQMKGVYVYGNTAWGYAGPMNYLLARLAWNPDADVDALFDEYLGLCYAEGAPEIKQLYTLLDSATEVYFNANHKENWTLSPDRLRKVYGANFAELERLYRAAEAKVTAPDAMARLGMLGANLITLHGNLRQIKAVPNPQNSSFYRSDIAFLAHLEAWEGTLAVAPTSQSAVSLDNNLVSVRPLPTSNAEAITPFLLRGDQRLILKPAGSNAATVSFSAITAPSGLSMWYLYDAAGARQAYGIVSPDMPVSMPVSGSDYYQLVIHAGLSSFTLTVENAAWALAGFVESSGLHFLGKTTPLYFEVPEGVISFDLWLSSAAPGETAAARLYAPDGTQIASFRTVDQAVDVQTITVAAGQSGMWKIVPEKADMGILDDVFIKLGPPLSGYLSIDSHAALGITRRLN